MEKKILSLVIVGMLMMVTRAYPLFYNDNNRFTKWEIPEGVLFLQDPFPWYVFPNNIDLPPQGCSEGNCMPDKDVPSVSLEGPFPEEPFSNSPIEEQQQQPGASISETSILVDGRTAISYLQGIKSYLPSDVQKPLEEFINFLNSNPNLEVRLGFLRMADGSVGLNIYAGPFSFSAQLKGDKTTLDTLMKKWEEVKKNVDNNGQLTPQGKSALDQLFGYIGSLLRDKKITLENAVVNKIVIKPLDPNKDKATIDMLINNAVDYLKKNGLGKQAETMRGEINNALKNNGVRVFSVEVYQNGKLVNAVLNVDISDKRYEVNTGYNEKGEIDSARMTKVDKNSTQVLSVEKSKILQGEAKEAAAMRYFQINFGITDPANHPQLKGVWKEIVDNWGNWTIASENVYEVEGNQINGKVNMILTYQGKKIELTFEYTKVISKGP
ncbi:MAG: hypothetical protein NC898_02855 [Candidatus Omnitrophica bacterium]|nr:hypothetical protein [Candidatus Omnitrophota bacterium]